MPCPLHQPYQWPATVESLPPKQGISKKLIYMYIYNQFSTPTVSTWHFFISLWHGSTSCSLSSKPGQSFAHPLLVEGCRIPASIIAMICTKSRREKNMSRKCLKKSWFQVQRLLVRNEVIVYQSTEDVLCPPCQACSCREALNRHLPHTDFPTNPGSNSLGSLTCLARSPVIDPSIYISEPEFHGSRAITWHQKDYEDLKSHEMSINKRYKSQLLLAPLDQPLDPARNARPGYQRTSFSFTQQCWVDEAQSVKRWYLQTSLEEIQPGSDLLNSHHVGRDPNSFSFGDIHSSHLEIGNPYSGHIKLRWHMHSIYTAIQHHLKSCKFTAVMRLHSPATKPFEFDDVHPSHTADKGSEFATWKSLKASPIWHFETKTLQLSLGIICSSTIFILSSKNVSKLMDL